jgi:Uma2 family endonuclease
VWEEGGVFPQVVFEVWSPNNRQGKMEEKRKFYEKHGAEEYYIVYPDFPMFVEGWRREGAGLVRLTDEAMADFTSPRLRFRFVSVKGQLTVYGPDGRELKKPDEIILERNQAERERAAAEERAAKLAAKLREMGIDPDAV